MKQMKQRTAAAKGLTIVGASAGSGKTYRLTEEVQRALLGDAGPRGELPIDPEGLVAVTYTKRAQVELESRIRRALLGSADPKRAARMPVAYLGTVHAVCLRWVKEYALDAGVSPDVQVLADDGLTLAQVLEDAIPADMRLALDEIAQRLEVKKDPRTGHVHWEEPIFEIIELARHGRVPPAELPKMADRSIRDYAAHWPAPVSNGKALDDALGDALDAAIRHLAGSADRTATTRDAQSLLDDAARDLGYGPLPWGAWQKLARVSAAKASNSALDEVRRIAADFERHPRFHADLRRFTELAFAAAAHALSVYAEWKATRGLVDYVDMVEHALELLEDEAVAEDLARQLRFVVVDELQDSSPLQLALFLRLHALAGRSTWVGDPKQCIFEYAGADPSLMDDVLRWNAQGGAPMELLPLNRRSRAELVEFANALFGHALTVHGFDRGSVVVGSKGADTAEQAPLPPLGVFAFDASNAQHHAKGVAAGVYRLLLDPSATRILDKETGEMRDLRPGDVAILVATNAEAEQLAVWLKFYGVRATLARSGLMATPEGTLLGAALAYLLDDEDRLAVAELEALHGFGGRTPEAWLESRLASETTPAEAWRERLDAARNLARIGSPVEIVEAILVALDMPTLAARWPDPQQRLANLDALRKFARVYETRCSDTGETASLAGLLRFLARLARPRFRHGDETRADEQFAGGDTTGVTLITYHRSKGLEWPVVILSSLARGPRRTAFDVSPESDSTALDPDDPLADRWIRYWPRPHQGGTGGFVARIEATDVGRRVADRERRERARLLYVGFTRARDHLVFAVALAKNAQRVNWLNELAHADGAPILRLPQAEGSTAIDVLDTTGAATSFRARVWSIVPPEGVGSIEPGERRWFSSEPTLGGRPHYWIQPSSAATSGLTLPSLSISGFHSIHAPLVAAAGPVVEWRRVGDAIHAFLASDTEGLARADRLERAQRLLHGHGVAAYGPEALLDASDAFTRFVEARVPGARLRREIPVEATLASANGERAIDGRIDLLIETDTEWIIVDHKSFPATAESALCAKALEFAPQLAAYALALRRVNPQMRIGAWLHFATAGAVVVLA